MRCRETSATVSEVAAHGDAVGEPASSLPGLHAAGISGGALPTHSFDRASHGYLGCFKFNDAVNVPHRRDRNDGMRDDDPTQEGDSPFRCAGAGLEGDAEARKHLVTPAECALRCQRLNKALARYNIRGTASATTSLTLGSTIA